MTALARLVIRWPRSVVALWCVIALGGGYCSSLLNDRLQNGGYSVSGSQSARIAALGSERFADVGEAQAYIFAIVPVGATPALRRDASLLRGAALGVRGVRAVGTTDISQDGRAILLPVTLRGGIAAAQSYSPALERSIRRVAVAPARVGLIGQVPVFNRYQIDAKHSLQGAALISFPVTLGILLVAFLSIFAAVLPLALATVSLGATFAVLYLLSFVVQLNVFVEDTVLILGLGLSIDFSLFMVTRVREYLAQGVSGPDAIAKTLDTTGRAILISGSTVAASLAGLFAANVGFLSSLAIGAIGVTITVVLAAITLAPAVLALVGENLERFPVRVAVSSAQGERLWQWLGAFVIRRRLVLVAVIVPMMLLLSLPALGLHVRFRTFSILPSNDPVRRATTEVERHFGPGFGAPIVVAARISPGLLEERVERQPGVAQIGIAERGTQGWTRVEATLRASPDSSEAEVLIQRLRVSLPRAVGRYALVGGPTAEALDLSERLNARTPTVVLIILGLELVFLTVALRAPVIAVKAGATTLLSVTTTLGILSLLFGGSDTLAYFVPLMLIGAVFGLSTDYEVFLLTRARELYRGGLSNTESIRTALVRSARSITLAGITMSAVFFAFASSNLMPYRQLGVGLGLAVLLDVTVVRALLVPATVAILGSANWWRPRLGRQAQAPEESSPADLAS